MPYYSVLGLTFIISLFWCYYFWKMLRRNEKRRFAFHIIFFRYAIPALMLFVFGITFVSHAMDLPAVIANDPSHYEGSCKIVMEELHDGVFTVEAIFNDTWAEYDHEQFPLIKEGKYYCEVEYYPGSSIGTKLQLYLDKNGEAVRTK